jgi:hypothetical protein
VKKTYDARGSQHMLSRTWKFDKEAYWHMHAYRILIFVSFVFGIAVIVTALLLPQALDSAVLRVLVLIVWILFTAQVFATAKAASLIFSGGLSSSYLNKSFLSFAVGKKRSLAFYRAFPYIVLAVWLIAFIFLVWIWFIE